MKLRRVTIARDDEGWYACRWFLGHHLRQHFYPSWNAAIADSLYWLHL